MAVAAAVTCQDCGRPFKAAADDDVCPRCGGGFLRAARKKPISEKLRALADEKALERELAPPPSVVIPAPAPGQPLAHTLVGTQPLPETPEPTATSSPRAESSARVRSEPRARRKDYSPVPYEPHLIYQFAAWLYAQAFWVMILWTVGGLLFGGLMGTCFGGMLTMSGTVVDPRDQYQARVVVGLSLGAGAVLGGFIGYLVGCWIAFWIKLRAQFALCVLKIEEHTRG